MFDAVIFDCDGVLVDSETLELDFELQELAALGLIYDRAGYTARFMGMNNNDFYAELDADRRALVGEPLPAAFRQSQRERMFKACEERLSEVPGAGRAVAAWQGAKAVASSSGSVLLKLKLTTTGLWDAFAPHVYGGGMVERIMSRISASRLSVAIGGTGTAAAAAASLASCLRRKTLAPLTIMKTTKAMIRNWIRVLMKAP